MQFGQVAESDEFVLGEVQLRGYRGRAAFPASGYGVKELVVHCRDDDFVEANAEVNQFLLEFGSLPGEDEALQYAVGDGGDIVDQSAGVFADAGEQFGVVVAVVAFQDGELFVEGALGSGDAFANYDYFLGGGGGGKDVGGGDEGAAVLGDAESGGQFGDAAFVDPGLGFADLIEGQPSHQAGGESEQNRAPDAHIDLGCDAIAEFKQPGNFCHHSYGLTWGGVFRWAGRRRPLRS